jgi:Ca2+-binding EF-hand superfamily protein
MNEATRNSQFALRAWLAAAVLLPLLSAGSVMAQPTSVPRVIVKTPARPPARKPATTDQRDVLLLLDGSPLHLRLNVALGGVSLVESRRQVVNKLMESLDKDKDGKLTRAEAAASPLLRTKERKNANAFLEKLKADTRLKRSDVEQKIETMGGEIVAYRQDMRTSENDIEVFKLLDRDSSGLLDASEMATASDLILSKDTDGDECVAFQEFLPPPDPAAMMQVALTPAPATPPPVTSVVADMVRDIREPLLPKRLLQKYDQRPSDKQLTAAELGWTKERLASIDEDGNGKLDAAELTHLNELAPDVDLTVDLKALQAEGGQLAVQGTAGNRLDDSARGDYAKVGFDSAIVTFSLRNIDPFATAIDDAMRKFNQFDGDANGYLTRDEVADSIRFQKELFELIDADGDEKLFADEMKDYIRARSDPAATSCRMIVYDTGYGFFMSIDGNADGRVSVREMRHAAESLAHLERDGKPGVMQKEPVRHFHIEFVRGSFQLFGASEQLTAQTPAFQTRRPTGPIWFQRMDKNNDGDLTWNEFFGPREVFHSLDGDHDNLLDPQEAAKAK